MVQALRGRGSSGVGDLLRDWRARRRLSQLELALRAGISQRHLSFIEIGRSLPSREMVLHLATHLSLPLRDRNALLLASGYAPIYPETPLDADAMRPVRDAVDKLLSSHEPFPATVVDRGWDLLAANRPAWALFTADVPAALLDPPNAMRVVLHPDGLSSRITNLTEYAGQLLTRLRRQVAVAPDPRVTALHEEVLGYPSVADVHPDAQPMPENMLFTPLRLRTPNDRELSFFSTIATFGTAVDITIAELSIESFHPADESTSEALRELFG